MRSRGFIIAVLVALANAPAGADLPQIKTRGVLRVVVAADEQPEMFNRTGSGEPGFDRELIEGFARLQKLKIEAVPVPRYDDRIPALLDDKGDVIVGIIDTEARRKLVDFTAETMPTHRVAVTRRPHRVLKTVEEFRTERVGILKGTTTWLGAAVEAGVPESKIQVFPDLPSLFEALKSERITATVMSASDLGLARRKHPDLQSGLSLGAPASAAWGLRKRDKELHRALDEYIETVRKTPTWSRLIVKYFGEEALLVLGRKGA